MSKKIAVGYMPILGYPKKGEFRVVAWEGSGLGSHTWLAWLEGDYASLSDSEHAARECAQSTEYGKCEAWVYDHLGKKWYTTVESQKTRGGGIQTGTHAQVERVVTDQNTAGAFCSNCLKSLNWENTPPTCPHCGATLTDDGRIGDDFGNYDPGRF